MIHVLNVQDKNRLKSQKGSGNPGNNVSLRDLLSPTFRNDQPFNPPESRKRGNTNIDSDGGGCNRDSNSMVTATDEAKTVISRGGDCDSVENQNNMQIYFHKNPNRSSGVNSRSSVNANAINPGAQYIIQPKQF